MQYPQTDRTSSGHSLATLPRNSCTMRRSELKDSGRSCSFLSPLDSVRTALCGQQTCMPRD